MDEQLKDKLLSGRYFITIAITVTYCFTIMLMVWKVRNNLSAEMVIAYLAGLASSAGLIWQWYFDKEEADPKPGVKTETILNEKTTTNP